jgi:hypothetical protein
MYRNYVRKDFFELIFFVLENTKQKNLHVM